LHDGTTGEALPAIVDLDLDELVNIAPPRGFGQIEPSVPTEGPRVPLSRRDRSTEP
jgi:hypothetical protein